MESALEAPKEAEGMLKEPGIAQTMWKEERIYSPSHGFQAFFDDIPLPDKSQVALVFDQ